MVVGNLKSFFSLDGNIGQGLLGADCVPGTGAVCTRALSVCGLISSSQRSVTQVLLFFS